MRRWIITLLFALPVAGCAGAAQNGAGDPVQACSTAGRSGDAANTVSVCNAALASGKLADKDRAGLLKTVGLAYAKLGQTDRAIASLTQAAGLDAGDADIYNDRGIAQETAGRHDQALADFGTAIGLDPNLSDAYANRAAVYADTGDLDRARAEYDQALRLAPADASVLKNRCLIRLEMADYDGAVADCDHALELKPDLTAAVFLRGFARLLQGRYHAAAVDLTAYQAAHPKEPLAVLWLHVARAHGYMDDRGALTGQVAALDAAAWPDPLLRYFLGQADEATVSGAASATTDKADPSAKADRQCQADYYLGEGALLTGRTSQAHQHFDRAVSHCAHSMLEYYGAKAELSRL